MTRNSSNREPATQPSARFSMAYPRPLYPHPLTVARVPLRTEPKIKWYAELCGPKRDEVERKLQLLVDALINDMLQPEVNGLERRK